MRGCIMTGALNDRSTTVWSSDQRSPITFRSGRGLTPLPLNIPTNEKILAVGGNQKVACALSSGSQSVNFASGRYEFAGITRAFYNPCEVIDGKLYGMQPACDRQRSCIRTTSQRNGAESGGAHDRYPASSCPCCHWNDRQNTIRLGSTVLGLAFDGTDGLCTIWAVNFLWRQTPTFAASLAYVMPFRLPGSEAAIREPWRVAVSLLHAAVP